MSRPSQHVHADFAVIGKRIRQRRLEFGLSTAKLAEMAGVARYTVVRIESGLPCTHKTLMKVRHQLRLFSDQLYRPAPESTNYSVHRASEMQWSVSMPKAEYQKRMVEDDPLHVNDEAERKRLGDLGFQPFFTGIMHSVLPGGQTEQALMELHKPSWVDSHYGEEFVYCLRGQVTIRVNDQPCLLNPGDGMSFEANLPHQYLPTQPIAKDEPPALILIVVTKKSQAK